jgi:hypothetical protein
MRPSLGFREPLFGVDQTRGHGATNDCEGDEHDGREPDVDDEDGADKEPAFGWE